MILCLRVFVSLDAEEAGEKSDPYCLRMCTPASTLCRLKVQHVKFQGSPSDSTLGVDPLSSYFIFGSEHVRSLTRSKTLTEECRLIYMRTVLRETNDYYCVYIPELLVSMLRD